jgi:hypothetical protein
MHEDRRCILIHCGVQVSTPHSVGFARLASEVFYPIRKVKLALLDIKYLTGWGYIKKLTLFTRVNGICKSLLTGLTVPSDFRLLTASSVLQPNNLKPPTKLTLMSEGAQRKRKKFFSFT